MTLSLRIPPEKEKLIQEAASKASQTKSAFILAAVDEKLGLGRDRERLIRELAGWLTHEEAQDLRKATDIFSKIDETEWE